jgi:flavin-dependent dehydrogenase
MTTDPSVRQTGIQAAYDAIVVGARCAGAAAAMLLARRGLRVLVVDRGAHGTDTLSTHALMRGAVLQLHRWNLLDRIVTAGTPPVTETSFHYADEVVRVPIKPRDGVNALYSPRRSVLDRVLVDGAREAGATVLYGTRVGSLVLDGDGRVRGVELPDADGRLRRVLSDIVIGADGLRSTVARLAGASVYRRGTHACGILYGYWRGLPQRGNQWRFNPGVSTGVIPTNDGLTCVFAAMPSARFGREVPADAPGTYRRVIAGCSPAFAASLEAAVQVGPLHGFPGQVGFFRRSWGPGWALVGDAAYFKDPITAHGITDALRDAELLAEAVAGQSTAALAQYEQARDDLVLRQFLATDAIASFEWDLSTLHDLHHTMSEEMSREVKAMRAWSHAAGAPLFPEAASA